MLDGNVTLRDEAVTFSGNLLSVRFFITGHYRVKVDTTLKGLTSSQIRGGESLHSARDSGYNGVSYG